MKLEVKVKVKVKDFIFENECNEQKNNKMFNELVELLFLLEKNLLFYN
jgi:hypothetical protein